MRAFSFQLSAFSLVISAMGWSGVAWAERPLTYREALEAAVAANPALVSARLSRDQAEASLLASRGIFDPSFDLTTSWTRSDNLRGDYFGVEYVADQNIYRMSPSLSGTASSGTGYELALDISNNDSTYYLDSGGEFDVDVYTTDLNARVTQQLLKGHRLAYNMQTITRATEALTQAELAVEKSEQETLAAAAQSYWLWAYQEELRAIAVDRVAVAEEDLRIGKLKLEAGDLAPLEVTRLQAALVQARSSALEARQTARRAADSLLLAMGQEPGQGLLPATAPGDVPAFVLDLDRAVEVALAQNLDLALVRLSSESARMDHSVARHASLPSLTVSGQLGVGTREPTFGDALGTIGGEESYPTYGVTGVFSVPIGNRAAHGDRDRALHALHAVEAEVVSTERSVRSQVELAVHALASAREKVELADANLRLADETLRLEVALADSGRRILKDVLEARAAADQARADAARARTEFRMAQVELLGLQGLLEVELP